MPGDLHDPEIRPLWEALAKRLAAGDTPAGIKTVTAPLTRTAQALIAGWLAPTTPRQHRKPLRTSAKGATIPVPRLLAALDCPPDRLRDLIEGTGTPIPDTAGARRTARHLRHAIDTHAAQALPDAPLLTTRLHLRGISEDMFEERRFLIDSLARARALLPVPRPVSLARFAHYCSGDPHYFDLGDTGHGKLLVLLARDLLKAPEPDTPAAERALLAGVGVTADRLSQTILLLNVQATGNGPTDRAINLARQDRRPVHVTLHDLTAHPPTLTAGQRLLVVENVSLIDEAVERGTTRPLACTAGSLKAVDHTLLALARDAGLAIEYAGDIDHWGHNIAATVHHRYQATLVAMDTAAQELAVGAEPFWTRHPLTTTAQEPSSSQDDRDLPAPRIYQENQAIIDMLLGPSPHDPLAHLHEGESRAPRIPSPAHEHSRAPDHALAHDSADTPGRQVTA